MSIKFLFLGGGGIWAFGGGGDFIFIGAGIFLILGALCHLGSVPLSAPRRSTTRNRYLQFPGPDSTGFFEFLTQNSGDT